MPAHFWEHCNRPPACTACESRTALREEALPSQVRQILTANPTRTRWRRAPWDTSTTHKQCSNIVCPSADNAKKAQAAPSTSIPTGDCPICCEPIRRGLDGLAAEGAWWCRQCHNCVHEGCMKGWGQHCMASGLTISCVICRAAWPANWGAFAALLLELCPAVATQLNR
jgi:hypothetical protein